MCGANFFKVLEDATFKLIAMLHANLAHVEAGLFTADPASTKAH